MFGKIVNVILKANNAGAGLINTLSNDVPTKKLAGRIGNLEIKSQSMNFGFQG